MKVRGASGCGWFLELLLGSLVLLSAPGTDAQPVYSVTELGTLSGGFSTANGINNLGQVVGQSDYHAFLYSGGHLTDLGALPGGNYSWANAINDNGQIVGT